MKMRSAVGLLMGVALGVHVCAQTPELDAAKASADLQEALKRESDARAAIAKNAVDIANAEASSRAALMKAQAEAEQARSSYYQSLVPDPTKYKVAAPGAPKLNASAAIRAFNETTEAAAMISSKVATVAGDPLENGKCSRQVWLLPGASMTATRSLITASLSTEKALEQLWSQLDSSRQDLAAVMSGPASAGPEAKFAIASVAAAAAVVQGVLSIATIAKPQFAFDSVSQTNTSNSVLEAKVFGSLAARPCYAVVDTNALLPLFPLSQPPVAGRALPAELAWLQAVRDQLRSARTAVRDALRTAEATRQVANGLRGAKGKDKDADAVGAKAEQIVAAAKTLTEVANEAEKLLAGLYAVDAQGNSLIDAAARGGRLRALLAASAASTFFLSVKTITSDVDLAAKDGLLIKASTSLSSNTIVSWQMTNVSGGIVSTGALSQATATEIRDIWP